MSSPVQQSSRNINQLLSQTDALSPLIAAAKTSQRCLDLLAPKLGSALHKACLAGGIENGEWCLLAKNAAVASKLKQMLPMLLQELGRHGAVEVTRIRLKIYQAA
jgi:Dna[CI] antecedent, DciA